MDADFTKGIRIELSPRWNEKAGSDGMR